MLLTPPGPAKALSEQEPPSARRPFGLGLDVKAAAEIAPACQWATDAEYREHFKATTLSASEYRDLVAGDREARELLWGHSSERTKLYAKVCRLRGGGGPKPC